MFFLFRPLCKTNYQSFANACYSTFLGDHYQLYSYIQIQHNHSATCNNWMLFTHLFTWWDLKVRFLKALMTTEQKHKDPQCLEVVSVPWTETQSVLGFESGFSTTDRGTKVCCVFIKRFSTMDRNTKICCVFKVFQHHGQKHKACRILKLFQHQGQRHQMWSLL